MVKTKHKPDCNKVFSRKDPTCPRCQELLNGAPARTGWGGGKQEQEAQQIAAIRAHNCKVSGCGPVCTFGDW